MNLCKTKGVLGSWKLWFSYINENKKKQTKSKSKFQLVFCRVSILSWREKGHEPSWKSFRSSSGSSQLGSDSSLVFSDCCWMFWDHLCYKHLWSRVISWFQSSTKVPFSETSGGVRGLSEIVSYMVLTSRTKYRFWHTLWSKGECLYLMTMLGGMRG